MRLWSGWRRPLSEPASGDGFQSCVRCIRPTNPEGGEATEVSYPVR
jgi:hypothetical protein